MRTEDVASSSTSRVLKHEPTVTVITLGTDTPLIEDNMIKEVLQYVEELADEMMKYDDIIQILEDFLHTLAHGSEHTINNRALQHFSKLKTIWENIHFIGVLISVKYKIPGTGTYRRVSRRKLSTFLMCKIRSDPSFEDLFKYQDQATMMRNALSVLIGYWSNEDMMEMFLLMGGRSLLTSVKRDDDILARGKETSKNKMSNEPSTSIEVYSPIEELSQDSSIKELADQLLKIPEAIELVEKFLMTLEDDVPVGNISPHFYNVGHYTAAARFWYHPPILLELLKALKQSTPLLNIFKKYSKEAQLLRCVERMTRIQKDPLLDSILLSDGVQRMRGTLSILFGYWHDSDVLQLFHYFCVSGFGVKADANVQVFEYLIDGPGDVEGLKNVLAEKYSQDSEEYMDLFVKIRESQKMESPAKSKQAQAKNKKSREIIEQIGMKDGHGRALITVLLRDGKVIMCDALRLC